MTWGTDQGHIEPLNSHWERRARVRVFFFSFLVIALAGLVYTWSRPALYQSEAVLSVVYEQGGSAVEEAFLSEQLVIHRQRLLGRQLVDALILSLDAPLLAGPAPLVERLQVDILDDSRLLRLSVTGDQAAPLKPVLSQWITLYLARFEDERAQAAQDENQILREQIAAMELRLQAKRKALEAFKEEYRITSLERDENRVLSQLKALAKSLDAATEKRVQAGSKLSVIRTAIGAGQGVVRPQDQPGIDQMEARAVALEERLQSFAELYTPAFMEIDTNIQALKRQLRLLREKIAARRALSLKRYVEEAERDLATARQQETKLKAQHDDLQQQVRNFSNHMEAYASQHRELEELQAQAQTLRSQLVEQEVKQPYQSQVRLLEPPYVPERPLSPDYWRDSGVSLLIGLGGAVLSVLLFNLLNPRRQPEILINTVPPTGLLRGEPLHAIESVPQRLLAETAAGISAQQCRQLIDSCEPAAALAVRLLLSGVNPDRLAGLRWRDVDAEAGVLTPSAAESMALSDGTLQLAEGLRQSPDQWIWADGRGEPLPLSGLDSLLGCAAYDAGVDPGQPVNAALLFDCYLGFLADQGLELGEAERYLGPLSDTQRAAYSRRLGQRAPRSLADVHRAHPATA